MFCVECGKGLSGRKTVFCGSFTCKNRVFRKRLRKEAIVAYGGCCNRCGFSDQRALQIDHRNGGGSKHMRRIGGSSYLLLWLKKRGFPKDAFQLLCANCNWIKRHENKEFNKKRS